MSEEKVVFITGASSGIGYATARHFAQRGYRVAATARAKSRLVPLCEQIEAEGGACLALEADVRHAAQMTQAIADTLAQFGHIDVVVANAGLGHRGSVTESDWDDVQTLIETNVYGALHTIRAAVPSMQARQRGHIVLVSSVTYNMTVPFAAYYAASKAFVSSIGRALRLELEADHIHVTDMIVGRTDTHFNRNRLGGERTGDNIPKLSPEQVADSIYRAVTKRHKQGYVRFFDRLTVLGSTLFPERIGRIALKQYK